MTLMDYAKSNVRTIVPFVVGLLATFAARHGINLSAQETAELAVAVGAVYYAVVRLLERYVTPRFGWLLGLASQPVYQGQPSDVQTDVAQVGPITVKLLSEVARTGARLGRHVEHDIRSFAYRVETAGVTIKTVMWRRYGGPLDQGQLRSCTGNAMTGLLMTAPFYKRGRTLRETDAVKLYEKATTLDAVPGAYPPNDTGSTGLAVAKAARAFSYITGYRHAFGIHECLAALMSGPVIVGTNWYDGMDTPDSNGLVHVTGSVRGGHEYELLGIDATRQLVWGENSWGRSWGLDGRFCMSWADLGRLLAERGDVVQPIG